MKPSVESAASSALFFGAGALLLDALAGLDPAAANGLAKASSSDESSFTGFATFFFFGSATSFFFEAADFGAGGGASATGFGSSGGGTLALLEEEAAGCCLTGAAAAEEEGLLVPAFSGPTVRLVDAAAAGVAGRGAKKLSFDCVSGIYYSSGLALASTFTARRELSAERRVGHFSKSEPQQIETGGLWFSPPFLVG